MSEKIMKSAIHTRVICGVALGALVFAPLAVAAPEGTPLIAPATSSGAPAATGPVTLADTMRAVLNFSPTLKSMQENRDVLRHSVRRSKAGWYPRVDLTGAGIAQMGSTSTRRGQNVNSEDVGAGTQVGLTMTQTIWDGKSTTNTVRATEYREQSMIERVQDNALSLALDGIIAHVNILVRSENVRLAEENVETHRLILSKQASLSTSGVSTSADVSQAQGRLIRAEATLADTINQLDEARISYRQLTGAEAGQLSPVPMPAAPPVSLPEMLEKTISQNPTLMASQSDTKAARSDRDVSDAAFQPTLALEVGPSYADTDSRLRGNYEWQMSATMRMRWNVYNGGGDEAERQAAAARVRMARQTVYATADSLAAQVRSAWTSYTTAEKLINSYTSAVQYNTETRNAYLEQFSVGIRSLLDVLDAESELFNSSTQLSLAHGNRLINAYKLLALQGLLLQEVGINYDQLDVLPGEAEGELLR